MSTWRPSARPETLAIRARCKQRARDFLRQRGVLEVDVPCLQAGANLDHGVEPMRIDHHYLCTSPEHGLKRLLCAGYGPCFSLGPAFRAAELGQRHNPEFTMLEWYQLDPDELKLTHETLALLHELTGLGEECEIVSWHEAFQTHAGIDPDTASIKELCAIGPDGCHEQWSRDELLDAILTSHIEPALGQDKWTVLNQYPADAAAQASTFTNQDGRLVARRFEIYRNGLELANGYSECTDAVELRQRHEHERERRRDQPAIDAAFHAAMQHGLPACAGVAVGFDRVVMLAAGCSSIAEVLCFPWDGQAGNGA